jgi:hypothetical protein
MIPSAGLYILGERLGSGSFGVVFKTLRGHEPLVAKRFQEDRYAMEDCPVGLSQYLV